MVQRVDFLLEASRGRKVLHLGCTNYPYTRDALEKGMLLHFDLLKTASGVVGFDADEEGIAILREEGVGDLHRADLEHLEELDLEETFDVIIAGEMIEHLNNPGLFLRGIKRFMHNQTDLVITTVNAYCAMRFAAYALRGKGGESEPVHPDHVAYYSYSTLKLLTQRAGLSLDEFCFYDLGREHRIHNRKILNLINDFAVWFSPQLGDGIIARCRLE